MRPDLSERLLFLRSFLANPRQVGAVLPTSERAVNDMLDFVNFTPAKLVVELGAGTGSHTGPVLQRMAPDARLVAFEIDPALAASLRARIHDPRLRVVEGSAEHLVTELAGERPDVVVSALPFTSLPSGLGRTILERTAQVLAPGGTLLVLQYSPFIQKELERLFVTLRRRICVLNVPPAFLYGCTDPRETPAA
ncbi:MAG: methyltransferase protein [Frankiales bacterium]|nr:methyltransferase protein [Frankiales bacterium]